MTVVFQSIDRYKFASVNDVIMATILRFEDLEIWQLARKIYKKILTISLKMKINHDFRLAEQIKGLRDL